MVELSEEVKNPIFRWWATATMAMGFIIVTPISFVYYLLYEGSETFRILIFVLLMTTIPISVIGTNFMYGLIFPKKVGFKQKDFDVIFKSKSRNFSVIYKEIESAIFLDDIFGVNGCTLTLKSEKKRYIGQIGKGLVEKLKEVLEKNRIPYETLSRKEYTNRQSSQR